MKSIMKDPNNLMSLRIDEVYYILGESGTFTILCKEIMEILSDYFGCFSIMLLTNFERPFPTNNIYEYYTIIIDNIIDCDFLDDLLYDYDLHWQEASTIHENTQTYSKISMVRVV